MINLLIRRWKLLDSILDHDHFESKKLYLTVQVPVLCGLHCHIPSKLPIYKNEVLLFQEIATKGFYSAFLTITVGE
jgi:hypothetical protein